jgi:serine/threonine-protein kinase
MLTTDSTISVSRAKFLAAVRSSGVLTAEHVDRLAAQLPPLLVSGPRVADALVGSGVLTRFQADRLLAGKYDGLVLGQCVILGPVGKTADTWVYKAKHRAMNRTVAVRVLAAERTTDPHRRASFQQQARSAAKLAHPNVLTVLDVNAVGQRVYQVTEHVEGTSLAGLIRLTGPPPVGRACEYIRQAALGLHHAHESGVAHGRFTPATVLIGHPGGAGPGDQPTVKVAEFGFGRAAGDGKAAGGIDPADYQAPELFHDAAEPTPAADLYALGATLYFALTGRPPYPGVNPAEKARQHLASDPMPVETVRPGVPPAVAAVVRELLAKKPTDRPSAAVVAARLAPFAGPDDTTGRVEFDFQAAGAGSMTGGSLSGLNTPMPAGDGSPWAGLDAADGLVVRVESASGRSWWPTVIAAAVVTAGVGLAAVAVMNRFGQ